MEAIKSEKEIPKSFIYEIYDGKPIYYKGYKEFLNQESKPDEVRFVISPKTLIRSCIVNYLFSKNKENSHFIGVSGVGLQLTDNTHICGGITIFDKSILKNYEFSNKYFDIPPLAVIEVDIEADVFDFGINEFNYYSMKTERLLNFGVKEVFWFFSQSKQVAIARPNQDWIITNWDKELVVLDEYRFALNRLLEKDGFKI